MDPLDPLKTYVVIDSKCVLYYEKINPAVLAKVIEESFYFRLKFFNDYSILPEFDYCALNSYSKIIKLKRRQKIIFKFILLFIKKNRF